MNILAERLVPAISPHEAAVRERAGMPRIMPGDPLYYIGDRMHQDTREWTRTPPTEPGAYWVRREGEEYTAIVEVSFEDRKQGFGPQMLVRYGANFLAVGKTALEWARVTESANS